MPPNLHPPSRQLAIHPQRNLPSSLLQKRCQEKFATVLQEYGEEEGYPVEWALIAESGRGNKMLLVSVYGPDDIFPIELRKDDEESDDEKEGEGEDVDADADGNRGDTSEKEAEEKLTDGYGKKGKEGDNKDIQGEGDKKLSKEDVKKRKIAVKELKRKEEEEAMFFMTETYKIPNDLIDEDSSTHSGKKNVTFNLSNTSTATPAKKEEEKVLRESYRVVGAIMDGDVEWMCDDSELEGFDDKTTYFSKDGFSMVHGVRFHDHIKTRKLALEAALERMRAEEEEKFLAEKQARKVAKKARQKAQLPAELSDAEDNDDAASRKRNKAKAKRSRQKERRAVEAEELEAGEEARKAAMEVWLDEQVREGSRSGDVESKMIVVDHNTKEGALAVAQAKKLGYPMLSTS